MEENNRVTVKIYGQEYTIYGGKSTDNIIRVSGYVDEKMRELGAQAPSFSRSELAVLTAVNVADEFFESRKGQQEMKAQKDQAVRDMAHYNQLWEEAKKNFVQYKEEAQSAKEEKVILQRTIDEKAAIIKELNAKFMELQEENESLQKKNGDLILRMDSQEEAKESNKLELRTLEEKCKEVENSFFDLQMENIQLKAELDRYKKIVE